MKQRGTLKAEEIHQAEQILPECFKVDSKQQRNLQNIEHRETVTLHR